MSNKTWKCKKGDIVAFRLSARSTMVHKGVIVNRVGPKLINVAQNEAALEAARSGRLDLLDGLPTVMVSVACLDEIYTSVNKNLKAEG